MSRQFLSLILIAAVIPIFSISAEEEWSEPDPRADLTADKVQEIVQRVQPGRNLTPEKWPDGKRVAVALTFDLDAELVWMDVPDQASAAELSRGQYGPRAGLQRILDLLEKKNVPATFFFPALILKMHPDAVGSIQKTKRHEMGFHGYAHESVGTLSEEQEREAMRKAMDLFDQASIRPRVYRSPSWDFSSSTLKLLKEFGFSYDSSLMGDDRPYEILAGGKATGVIELPVDWSLDDWPYFQLEWEVPLAGLRTPDEVLRIWIEEFNGIRSEGGLFILTMHPQVIGRWSRIRMLEQLIDHMILAGDVWFTTLGDAGRFVRSASQHQ